MADMELYDIVRSTFPDKWEFIRIKKVKVDPSGNRWKVVYTAPKPMKLDGELLARSFEEQLDFLDEVDVEREQPEKLEDACTLDTLRSAVSERLEDAYARIATEAPWEREGEAVTLYADVPQARPMEKAVRAAIAAVTGFNVVVKVKKPKAEEREGTEILLGGRPVNGEATRIETLNEESGTVVLEGNILKAELRPTKRERNGEALSVFVFFITDNTGTVQVFRFDSDTSCKELAEVIKPGMRLRVRGQCEQRLRPAKVEGGTPTAELSVRVQEIMKVPKKMREDTAAEKRIELHLHTQMSAMDSVLPVGDAIATAKRWGHKALAITDHGVVQSFPDAVEAGKKAGVKIILGMEAYLVPDSASIVSGDASIGFDGRFVVFDLETTGFDPATDGITEIGAVRVENGQITDRFSTFVNPGRPIPANVSHLTGITDDMVKDAPAQGDALARFQQYVGDDVLVAHNSSFDMSFVRGRGAAAGLMFPNAVLDTLGLARALYPDMRRHKLDTLTKKLGVKLEGHHRAVNDAEATAGIFLIMAAETERRHGKTPLNRVNELFSGSGEGREYHAVLLVQNREGLINLYRLVSLSHLEHFRGKPRIPKSELSAHRAGLLVGSACEAGELYQALISGQDAEAERIAEFYDYLEIMPDGNNQFLLRTGRVRDAEGLHALSRKIIELGRKLGKIVVATGDAHFLEPEDECYRRILQAGQGFSDADYQAPLYYHTTGEMLSEFAWLGEEGAKEVVIDAPNAIAALIGDVEALPPYQLYAPKVDGAEEFIVTRSWERAKEIYGDPLPEIVEMRLNKELGSITKYGFAVLFWIAQALVTRSLSDGYLVGSRGSVGSSLVATMTGITEVNALPPHYVCPNPDCKHSDFTPVEGAGCGPDLPAKNCPECGTLYRRDGYDIPFEVFLGFEGDKVPDIDLNFSGENQPVMHKFTEEIFGANNVFRAGTISTIAERTAYGFVLKYMEERGKNVSPAEVERLATGTAGVKRTTGQHPGGIIIVPKEREIYEFTPIQHPADDRESGTITTHFDFNSLHDRLVKVDILGHDDPTMLKMLKDLTGLDPVTILIDDPDTMALFTSTKSLGVKPEDILCDVGTYGVPEFGTKFVRGMLDDTRPTTIAELVRISGLSHGTDVWLNNAQDLILNGVTTLKQAICTRDDIMLALMAMGVPSKMSFDTMESVRKGKGLKPAMEQAMTEHSVPGWFIESCKKIKYMFPKAHAVAYVTMGLRVAYYKVHYPREYYATYYTVRADDFDASVMLGDYAKIKQQVQELDNQETKLAVKDKNKLIILQIVLEMLARGINFTNIDIYKSDAVKFLITDTGMIRPPLNALPGLGGTAAVNIVKARAGGSFISEEDLKKRAGISSAVLDVLREFRCLEGIPKQNQVSLFDLMGA